ncbi:MAG: HDOD domain-containing protein [Gemmatimonadaceae bacterium]|nr:HDOD domain-containing protein [Gemmatimonadaceae bacterium]
MPTDTESGTSLLVARQPLFDRSLDIIGYELLYRENALATVADSHELSMMTHVTLASAVLGIGLEPLVGSTPAWINLPQDLLEQDLWHALDPRRSVIEVHETTEPTEPVVSALRRARAAGYSLALDDYLPDGKTAGLVGEAQMVKVEMTYDHDLIRRTVAQLRRGHHLLLVAEKVETPNDFEFAYELGFDLFQGWHFGMAETVSGRDMPPVVASVATAMQRLRNPSATDADIEASFQADPTLVIKLLQLANSASYGFRNVTSARKALQLLGRGKLYQWLAILLVACVPRRSGVDDEHLRIALERARFCELIGGRIPGAEDASAYFLSGLLSRMDALIGVPIATVLDRVHAPQHVRDAILGGGGVMAEVLRLSDAVERAQFADARKLADALGVDAQLHAAIVESATWAADTRASLA